MTFTSDCCSEHFSVSLRRETASVLCESDVNLDTENVIFTTVMSVICLEVLSANSLSNFLILLLVPCGAYAKVYEFYFQMLITFHNIIMSF